MMKKTISAMIIAIYLCLIPSCASINHIPSEEQVRAICELATLECYYNNVAKSIKEKGYGIAHVFEKEREMWIEYEGIAKIGIDMNLVKMDVDGTDITISMPKAQLINIDTVDGTLNSESYTISKDGILNKNKISTEEQQMAVVDAQNEMSETVMNNKALFERAESEARKLIGNYIIKLGEISGVEYNIVWEIIE